MIDDVIDMEARAIEYGIDPNALPLDSDIALLLGGIENGLRVLYPHGHRRFLELTLDEVKLHSDKNHDYAKGGDPLGNFKRVSALMKMYPGFPWDSPTGTAVVQMLKQLDAALWMTAQSTQAKVEGTASRWRDISVFAKLIPILQEEETK